MRDSPKENSLPPEISPLQEISLLVDREENTPEMTRTGGHQEEIQEFTLEKKLEITPEEREDMKKETVTLAMAGDAEGAARRP